jgi:hypothetical protein
MAWVFETLMKVRAKVPFGVGGDQAQAFALMSPDARSVRGGHDMDMHGVKQPIIERAS